MRYTSLLLAILLAACSKSPSAPAGIDPSVLIVNLTGDNIKLVWATDSSGSPKIDTVVVAANTTLCEKWTQSFDSLYTEVYDSSTTHPGAFANVVTPWVHFAQYPDYFQRDTVEVAYGGQNITITNRLDNVECQ